MGTVIIKQAKIVKLGQSVLLNIAFNTTVKQNASDCLKKMNKTLNRRVNKVLITYSFQRIVYLCKKIKKKMISNRHKRLPLEWYFFAVIDILGSIPTLLIWSKGHIQSEKS
jgi:hypothetical protein